MVLVWMVYDGQRQVYERGTADTIPAETICPWTTLGYCCRVYY